MELYLKISQDEAYEFFEKFNALSPLRKEIWKYTLWCVKNHLYCVPSQSHIAEKKGCCRQAVSEAFKVFKEYGWLSLRSRGFKRSKIISIPLHLQQIDLVKKNYFRRVETTSRATRNYSNFTKKTSRTGYPQKVDLKVPEIAHKLGFSLDSGLKLGLLTESILQETLYQAKQLGKKGFKPANEERYFVGMAFGIAKKEKFTPNWRAYYATVQAS